LRQGTVPDIHRSSRKGLTLLIVCLYFLCEPHKHRLEHRFKAAQSHKNNGGSSNDLKKPVAFDSLCPLKLGSSDLPSHPGIVHESNKDFISPAVDFGPSRDPGFP
jgi:hypothetical protein